MTRIRKGTPHDPHPKGEHRMTGILRVLASGTGTAFLVVALSACAGGTGESAATKSAAPAAAAVVAKALILQVDTVRSPEGLTDEEKVFLSCVQTSRFPQGSRVVWRVKVIDPLSGKSMDDKQLKSLVLGLPDGKTQDLKYGGHPGGTNAVPTDFFWTSGFSLAKDYPTGAFNYTLKATGVEGLIGTWDQFKVPAAMLQVVALGKR